MSDVITKLVAEWLAVHDGDTNRPVVVVLTQDRLVITLAKPETQPGELVILKMPV